MRRILASANNREHTSMPSESETPQESQAPHVTTLIAPTADTGDGRMKIDVIGGKLEPLNKCSRKITETIYERLEPSGFNWKSVSDVTKNFYFEEFKKYFVWRSELSEEVVYDAWLSSARLRYSEICCSARRAWEENRTRNNRIGRDVWLSWVQYWNTPSFKEKSEIQKKNRRSGVDGHPSTHTGGSASHKVHAARLEEILKRRPTPGEVYKYTHSKGHDSVTFVDPKSKRTYEMMESLRMQHTQNVDESTVSQPIDEWKLYLDAVGGKNKKNIIYGLGSSQTIFYGSGKYQNNASGSSHCDNQDHQNMQTQLQEMKNLLKSMQEEQENRLKTMESRLAMMFEARTNGHPDSPPDADLDGHCGDN